MTQPIRIQMLQEIASHADGVNDPILLVLEDGDALFCGLVLDGLFGYRIGVRAADLAQTICDFEEYESSRGRTPLLFALCDCAIPSPDGEKDSDQVWLVHSTDTAAGESVLKAGRLCSRRRLECEGIEFRAFGRDVLGEPTDYRELINLAPLDSPGPEIVVASKQHGRFCSDGDAYQAGVRFYFHPQSLKQQPGYARFMGGSAVRDSLELGQVEHHVVSASELTRAAPWTPREFTAAANALFAEKLREG